MLGPDVMVGWPTMARRSRAWWPTAGRFNDIVRSVADEVPNLYVIEWAAELMAYRREWFAGNAHLKRYGLAARNVMMAEAALVVGAPVPTQP
jgi:hypothetical protein